LTDRQTDAIIYGVKTLQEVAKMEAKGFVLGRFDGTGKFCPIAIVSIFSKAEGLEVEGFFNEIGDAVIPLEEAYEMLLKEARENLRKKITDEEILELSAKLEVEELLEDLPSFGLVFSS
jgi:hypothetical protein